MVPLNVYLATPGVECVTMFEALYPAFTFFLASLAVACYRGYYGVVLHPSTFKFLRLKYRLEGLKVIFHYFETGQNVVSEGTARNCTARHGTALLVWAWLASFAATA